MSTFLAVLAACLVVAAFVSMTTTIVLWGLDVGISDKAFEAFGWLLPVALAFGATVAGLAATFIAERDQ